MYIVAMRSKLHIKDAMEKDNSKYVDVWSQHNISKSAAY